ncbi:twin-arginine translocation signal domain-containing protein [Bradyrhizobium retamae]|uniref:twin-arginine translocation signal domain-containing protein n=1 Tax=Bradyrhizobium retamae TaxID=1300035 RepID=UPI0009E7F2D0
MVPPQPRRTPVSEHSKKESISRRNFIGKTLCGAALAGTALPAWAAPPITPLPLDDGLLQEIRGRRKVSKASAQYRDSPNGPQRCGGCVNFRGGTCAIVEGRISANGWCRHYRAASRGRAPGASGGGGARGGGSSY